MKFSKRTAAFMLACVIGSFCAFGTSATQYAASVVNESFSSASTCGFLPAGDLNADGTVNATDVAGLKQLLLGDANSHADVNGDLSADVKDLVRQKKVIAAQTPHVVGGTLALNGSSVYGGEVLAKMGTGASYVISFDHRSTAPIKVIISGFGDDLVFEAAASSSMTNAAFTVRTPLSKVASSDAELLIVGEGTIDNFSVIRIQMDNELVENWN